MTYGDYNGNGHVDMGDADRWQLDNGGYPGQFENTENGNGSISFSGAMGSLQDGCLMGAYKFLMFEAGCAIAIGVIFIGFLFIAVLASMFMVY